MNTQLIFPMAFYVLGIWLLGLSNLITRVRAVRRGELSPKYFKAFSGETPPDRLIVIGRHYDNQFQLPILFLITACAHMIVGQTNTLTIVLAWAFVVTRAFHSYVHLGKNHVIKRVIAFASGWLVTLSLWAQLVYFAILSGF